MVTGPGLDYNALAADADSLRARVIEADQQYFDLQRLAALLITKLGGEVKLTRAEMESISFVGEFLSMTDVDGSMRVSYREATVGEKS